MKKSKESILAASRATSSSSYIQAENVNLAAEPEVQYTTKEQLTKAINTTRKKMENAAKALDFIEAARLRDEMSVLEERMEKEYK